MLLDHRGGVPTVFFRDNGVIFLLKPKRKCNMSFSLSCAGVSCLYKAGDRKKIFQFLELSFLPSFSKILRKFVKKKNNKGVIKFPGSDGPKLTRNCEKK